MRRSGLQALLALGAVAIASAGLAQEQMADPDFRPVVSSPAYGQDGPTVLLDEAHGSVQTAGGRYGPFVALRRADGYVVESGTHRWDEPGALDGVDVLVVSNAQRPAETPRGTSAFSEAEITAVEAWVRNGGALLLAADHTPHGDASAALAQAFGVSMGRGYAFRYEDGRTVTFLTFSREAGTLGSHPILEGRDPTERIDVVRSFTGQSVSGPPGSDILLAMAPGDREAPDQATRIQVTERLEAGEDPAAVFEELSVPVDGRAQGLAFAHGRGRVVVLGEAGMLTAQIVRFPEDSGQADIVFGLQTDGHDDQQFALNVLRWLSGLLP